MKGQFLIFAGMILLTCHSSLDAQNQKSDYKLARSIQLTEDGGWDYLSVDEANQKLYVSHSSQVNVVDLKKGAQIAVIPSTDGVHGIAIANDLNKAFISCGRDSSVSVVDLGTFKLVAKITGTGKNPDAILYDPFSKKVFTFNGRSSNATVIDAVTFKVITNIPLSGKPEFSQTDGKGKIFVNIEDKSCIAVINSVTLKVENVWSIAPGEEPSGLALDNETHRLFSVCGNKLMVVTDAQTGKVVTTLPIGDRCDGVAFDPEKKLVYSSNGEGTITVVQEVNANTFKVIETIQTLPGARTIAVDKVTHHLYLPTAEFGAPVQGERRPPIKPNTFMILDIEPHK